MPNNELQVYDYLGTLAPEVRGSLKAYYLQLTRTTTDQFSVADRVGQLEDSFFYGTISYIDQHFSLHVMCVFPRGLLSSFQTPVDSSPDLSPDVSHPVYID